MGSVSDTNRSPHCWTYTTCGGCFFVHGPFTHPSSSSSYLPFPRCRTAHVPAHDVHRRDEAWSHFRCNVMRCDSESAGVGLNTSVIQHASAQNCETPCCAYGDIVHVYVAARSKLQLLYIGACKDADLSPLTRFGKHVTLSLFMAKPFTPIRALIDREGMTS